MYELSIEDFTKFVVRQIENIGNVVLDNPDKEETFPLSVVNNAMQSIRRTEDNFPIFTRFSINIENWSNSKYEAMRMFHEVTRWLRTFNFTPVGAPIDTFDTVTRKYRYGGRYEVNYNGLTNSFERIKH